MGRTFSRIPPTGVTAPRRVISPVMAMPFRGAMPRTATRGEERNCEGQRETASVGAVKEAGESKRTE